MNKLYFTVLISLVSTSAFAETYYDRMKYIFDQGTKPEMGDLIGNNIGRCFQRDKPNIGINALLNARIDNAGLGPIDADTAAAGLIVAPHQPLGYFDNMSSEQLKNEISEVKVQLLPVRQSETALLVDQHASTIQTWEVKKNGNYLAARLGTYWYCYTFIKH